MQDTHAGRDEGKKSVKIEEKMLKDHCFQAYSLKSTPKTGT